MVEPPQTAPETFDRALLRRRQARAQARGVETFLFDRVAADLADRLGAVMRRFSDAVDVGSPLPMQSVLAGQVDALRAVTIPDDEALELAPLSCDLALSVLALQSVNDLPGVLVQIRRALRPDGLLLAAWLGGDTLTELRQSFAIAESEIEGGVSPRVAPFADLRDAGGLLQRAGLALPVADVERIVVRYDDVFGLMRDLRAMGATNVLHERSRGPLRRATLLRMAEVYAEKFADPDGRLRATFDVVWLSGWTPHDSQQKPLQPGSAKASLADAVKNVR